MTTFSAAVNSADDFLKESESAVKWFIENNMTSWFKYIIHIYG